jgi:hypothetical protein
LAALLKFKFSLFEIEGARKEISVVVFASLGMRAALEIETIWSTGTHVGVAAPDLSLFLPTSV